MFSENKKEFPFSLPFSAHSRFRPIYPKSSAAPLASSRGRSTTLRFSGLGPAWPKPLQPNCRPGPPAVVALRQPAWSPSGPGVAVHRGHYQDARRRLSLEYTPRHASRGPYLGQCRAQRAQPCCIPPPHAFLACAPHRPLQSAAAAIGAKLRRVVLPDEVVTGADVDAGSFPEPSCTPAGTSWGRGVAAMPPPCMKIPPAANTAGAASLRFRPPLPSSPLVSNLTRPPRRPLPSPQVTRAHNHPERRWFGRPVPLSAAGQRAER
jgi:hypothetical protein